MERRTPQQEQIRRADETRRAAERNNANAVLAAQRHEELELRRLLDWPAGPLPGSDEHERMRLDVVDKGRREDKRKRDEEELPKEQAHASGVRACPEPTPVPDQQVNTRCSVCLHALKTHAFVPCGHKCVCGPCSLEMRTRGSRQCPVCRMLYTSCLRVFG